MAESIRTVGVVGAGTMGAGIAETALSAGFAVTLCDVQPAVLEQAKQHISDRLRRKVEKGRLTPDEAHGQLGRLLLVTDMAQLGQLPLVVEAVPEKMDLKRTIFRQLEDVCAGTAILATNTSSLSITVIASVCRNPGRVVGMHFFNPAPVMQLVEVVTGEDTDPGVVKGVVDFARALGKQPIVCSDTPGFIVNRVARNYYGEALRVVGEGTASVETVDLLMQRGAGFPMGPFTLMDLIGIDVNYDVTQSVYQAYHHDPRYRPHLLQHRQVATGHIGRKSGRGFYRYSEGRAVVPEEPAHSHHVVPVDLREVAVVGDTPLAMHLQQQVAQLSEQDCSACGVVYSSQIQSWDSVAIRWRADEVEARMRSQRPSLVVVSLAGEPDYLRQLLQAVERGVSKDTTIVTSLAGPSATEQAAWLLHPERVRGFYTMLPRAAGPAGEGVLEWARPLQGEESGHDGRLRSLAEQLNLLPVQIRDCAGGVMMRLLCMVFNEAAEVMREGVASPHDVDTGMRLGTNHPAGPAAWMDHIGIPTVWYAQSAVWQTFGDDRYRPSPALRQLLHAGWHGECAGRGWYSYDSVSDSTQHAKEGQV